MEDNLKELINEEDNNTEELKEVLLSDEETSIEELQFTDDELETLNYTELRSLRSMASKDLETLLGLEMMFSQAKEMHQNISNVNEMVGSIDDESISSNAIDLEDEKFNKEYETQMSEYRKHKVILENSIAKIESVIERKFKDVEITTKYITEELIESFDKSFERIDRGTTDEVKRRSLKKINRNKKKALLERANMTFIMNKSESVPSVRNITDRLLANKENAEENTLNILRRKFTGKEIGLVKGYMTIIACNSKNKQLQEFAPIAVLSLMTHIAHIMDTKISTGESLHGELVFSNILDIVKNRFDLCSIDEVNEKLEVMLVNYVQNCKFSQLTAYKKSKHYKNDIHNTHKYMNLIAEKISELQNTSDNVIV